MAMWGTLTYKTEIDTSGVSKGINDVQGKVKSGGTTVKSILKGLGIAKLVSTAFNTITSSIDGAISRVDTLNNFPKVMQSLGYSSEEASKSISNLSDGIEGLPTTLDEIVGNTQLLTASLGDLGKGTESAIALNDMFLAGGQGAEAASRALTQYNQILAKGKVDQQSWNTLIEVAPGQMNELAQSLLGSTANQKDLYEALQEGTLSIEDMNNAIIKLDNEGGAGFSSFHDQALNATGGIETSITNIKTAITKGLANAIQTINKSLEEAGLPTIQETLAGIKTKINEIFTKSNEVIPKIIKWLAETYEKLEPYLPVIEAIAAAIGAIVIAVEAYNAVAKVMTAVQTALNVVMSANPIALIVLAIVGLVAAFVVLWNKCDAFREFWINLWDNIKEAFETIWNAIGTFFTETIPNWIQGIIDWFKNLPYEIGYALGQFLGKIIQLGIDMWDWVTTDLPKIIEGIINWFKELPGKIWNWLKQVPSKIKDMATNMVNTIKTELPKFINKFVEFIQELPEKMLNIGKNIVEGIWNGIKNATSWIKKKVKEFASGVVDGIKDALGIHSPSKVMAEQVGQWIPKGISVGIDANTDSVTDTLDTLSDDITNRMKQAVNVETGAMSISGTTGSVTDILNANSNFESNINIVTELDGEKVYENQQIVQARKNLQYGGVR